MARGGGRTGVEKVTNLKEAMDLASGLGRPLSQEDLLQLSSCTDCAPTFQATLINLMSRDDVQVKIKIENFFEQYFILWRLFTRSA
jgi:hypothetical protein